MTGGPVLDCSITAAWALADEHSTYADSVLSRVAETGAVAPSLWWAELHSVLLVAERRGRIQLDQVTVALQNIRALDVRLDHTPESSSVLRLARGHGLTAYDAFYLELAIRQWRPLATLDSELAAAAAREGLPALSSG